MRYPPTNKNVPGEEGAGSNATEAGSYHAGGGDATLAAAQRYMDRARREIELCAMMAAGPRRARAVLDGVGLTLDDMTQDDARCLFAVLLAAGEPAGEPWSRKRIEQLEAASAARKEAAND